MTVSRCAWANTSKLLTKYHDEEWGDPIYDDQKLFEILILESQSCGLSWELILRKSDHMKNVFDNFDPKIMITYSEAKIDAFMQDTGVIRNRLKLKSLPENAKAYLKLKETGSLSDFLWGYVNHKTIINDGKEYITKSKISEKMNKDLKKLGFKFLGSTILYSFMQVIGLVDDHADYCFKKRQPTS